MPSTSHLSDVSEADELREAPGEDHGLHLARLRRLEGRRLWNGMVIGVLSPLLVASGLLGVSFQIASFPGQERVPDFGTWLAGLPSAMPAGVPVSGTALALVMVGLTLFLATAVGRVRADTPHEAARQDVLNTLTAAVTGVGAVLSWLMVPLAPWQGGLPLVDVGAAVWCALLNGALLGLTREDAHKISQWIEETRAQLHDLEVLASKHLPPVAGRDLGRELQAAWAGPGNEQPVRRWWRREWAGFPWRRAVFGGVAATVAACVAAFPHLEGVGGVLLAATLWQAWWCHAVATVVAGSVRDRWGRFIWPALPGFVAVVLLPGWIVTLEASDPPFTWAQRVVMVTVSVLFAPVLAWIASRRRPATSRRPWLAPLIVTKITHQYAWAQQQLQSQQWRLQARQATLEPGHDG